MSVDGMTTSSSVISVMPFPKYRKACQCIFKVYLHVERWFVYVVGLLIFFVPFRVAAKIIVV